MVGIISNDGLGLFDSSMDRLGTPQGQPTSLGQAKGSAYVNIATGNLSVQFLDESLSGKGADLHALRTYNSRGDFTNGAHDGDNDGWRWLGEKRVVLTGTLNNTTSTVMLTLGDGGTSQFKWLSTNKYQSTDGSGAHDLLEWNTATSQWKLTEDGGSLEHYFNGSDGWIDRTLDTTGTGMGFDYTFTGNKIASVTDLATGQRLDFLYGTNGKLETLKTFSKANSTDTGTLLKQVSYFYHPTGAVGAGLLAKVTTDLTPEDTTDNLTYSTEYAYEVLSGNPPPASTRIASISQSDGTSANFTYDASGRVLTVTDQTGTTTFTYNNNYTSVNNSLSTWNYSYDATSKQLLRVSSGVGEHSTYFYDSNGNVSTVTNGTGNTLTYLYDANGNRTKESDTLGNTITRTFGLKNELLTETRYSVASPTAPSGTETTRYVYDTSNRLRFIVSAEGRITEHNYNTTLGLLTSTRQYAGKFFDLTATPSPTLANLTAWVTGLTSTEKPLQQLTEFVYDYRGNLEKKTAYAVVNSSGAGVLDNAADVTKFVYDEYGQLKQAISLRGASRTTEDTFSSYAYDGMGRQISIINEAGTTTTTYSGLTTTVTNTARGLTVVTTTDTSGRVTEVRQSGDSTNRITKYYYDAAGQLRMTEDPTGARNYLFYDHAGRVIAKVNPAGAVTGYTHDKDGRVLTEIRYANKTNTAGWFNGTTVTEGGLSIGASGTQVITDAANDRKTTNVYDAAGRLQTSTTDGAATITNTYDGASRLIKTQQGDRITKYYYDKDGRQVGMLDAERFLTQYVYDQASRLTLAVRYGEIPASTAQQTSATFDSIRMTVNNGARLTTYYFYDAEGRQVGIVNEQGFLTETVYDVANNQRKTIQYKTAVTVSESNEFVILEALSAVKARAGTNNTTTIQFDSFGRTSTVTTQDATISRNVYDTAGRLVRQIQAEGTADQRASRTRYNAFGEVTGVVSGQGESTLPASPSTAEIDTVITNYGTRYDIDGAGRKIAEYQPNGQKTLMYYNLAGQLEYTVNALGEVSQMVYNAFGQITTLRIYTGRIDISGLTGGLTHSTLTTRISGIAQGSDDKIISTTYNRLGLVYTTTDANGYQTVIGYNNFGEQESERRYITNSPSTSALSLWGRDKLGRAAWFKQDMDAGGINLLSQQTSYDGFGRIKTSTDANGKITTTNYQFNGRLIEILDPLGRSTKTEIDALGRTVKAYDALGNFTSYSYDDTSRSLIMTSPDGVTVTTWKNRHGETIQVRDGNGGYTKYKYNRNGTLEHVVDAEGVRTVYNQYDNSGRLWKVTDANGAVTRYTYNSANRAVEKVRDFLGLYLSTRYVFDGQGRQFSVTEGYGTAEASETQYIYDRKGQISQIVVDPDGLKLSTKFTYDGLGQTTKVEKGTVVDPAQQTTIYNFDKLGRKTSETVDPNGLNITTQYQYDDNGNLVRKIDANGNYTSYVYDAANQLRFAIDAEGAVSENIYDANGNVVRTVQYATKLSASEIASITTLKTVGTNRLLNSIFSNPGSNGVPENWISGSYLASANVNVNYSPDWTLPSSNPDEKTVFIQQLSAGVANAYQEIGQWIPAITEGKKYSFSVYTDTHRATGSVHIVWYDINGNSLGSTDENAASRVLASEGSGGTSLLGYKRIVAQGIAPQGAVKAVVLLRKYNTDAGQTNSYLFAVRAQFEEIPVTAALPTDWVKSLIKLDAANDRTTNFVYDKANRLQFTINAEGAVSENIYDANGNVVRTVQYTNKLSAAEIASITTLKTVGTNRLSNGTFSNPGSNGIPEGWQQASYRASGVVGVNHSGWTAQGLPAGDNTVFLQQNGRDPVDAYQDLFYEISSVTAGSRYSFSAYTGAHRASVVAFISWFDIDGAFLGTTPFDAPSWNAQEASGGSALSSYKRVVAQGVAPAGAVKARAVLRKGNSVEGAGDSWLFAAHAQFEEIPATSTLPTDWVKSLIKLDAANDRTTNFVYDKANRLQFTVNAEGAVSENIYDANGNVVRTVQYGTKLSATEISSLTTLKTIDTNRLKNSTFSNPVNGVPEGWNLITVGAGIGDIGVNLDPTWTVQGLPSGDNTVWFNQGSSVSGAFQQLSQDVPVVAGKKYAFSVYAAAHRAEAQLHLVWHDANGNLISAVSDSTSSHDGGSSLSGYDRLTAVGIAPAGAVYAELTIRKGDTNAGAINSYLFAVHAQFEEIPVTATLPTDWIKSILKPSTDDRITDYTYDKANRQTKTTMAGWYDATDGRVYGNKEGQSDRFQRTIEVTYDAVGNAVANKIRVGLSDYAYQYKTYDKAGREVNDIDALGYVTQKTYDALGNVKTLTRSSASVAVKTSGYWLNTDIAAQSGRTINYEYDKAGRQTKVTQPSATTNFKSSGVYTAFGVTEYQYDALGNLTKQSRAIDNSNTKAETYFYYDVLGRQILIVDAEGYGTETIYNQFGEVNRITEYFGIASGTLGSTSVRPALATDPQYHRDRITDYTYDNLGRVKTTKRRLHNELDTTTVDTKNYNSFGEVKDSKDALNNITRMEYNRVGQMTKTIEPVRTVAGTGVDVFKNQATTATPTTEFFYNTFGESVKEVRSTNAGRGATITIEHFFDLVGNEIEVKDASGNITKSAYNVNGKVIRQRQDISVSNPIVDSNMGYAHTIERRYEYDKAGRQTASLDVYAGQQSGQVNVYNGYGEVTNEYKVWGPIYVPVSGETITSAQLMSGALNNAIVSSYGYDAAGRVQYKLNAEGYTYFFYDLMGNVTRTEQRGTNGSTVDARITQTTYNKLGHVTEQRLPSYGSITAAVHAPVIYRSYDRWGNVLSEAGATATKNYTYNQDNKLLSDEGDYEYMITYSGTAPAAKLRRELQYDDNGQLVKETQISLAGAGGELGRRTAVTNTYNAVGQLIQTKDATNVTQKFVYDSNGNRVGTMDGLGHVMVDEFNANGQIITHSLLRNGTVNEYKSEININPTAVTLATYFYDQAGRKYAEGDGLGNKQYYRFDERGNMVRERSRAGMVKIYNYDELGHKTHEIQEVTTVSSYTPYGSNTPIITTTVTQNELNNWSYKYGSDFRNYAVDQLQTRKIANNNNLTYDYTYSRFGQLETETLRGTNNKVSYTYWENGLQKMVKESNFESFAQSTYVTAYTRDQWSQTTYYYDVRGNKTAEDVQQEFHQTAYTETIPVSGPTGGQQQRPAIDRVGTFKTYYEYDSLNRLRNVTSPVSALHMADRTHQSTRVQSIMYSYDEWGNRRRIFTEYKLPTEAEVKTKTEWYSYDDANRVIVEAGVVVGGVAVANKDQGTVYGYDDDTGRRETQQSFKGLATWSTPGHGDVFGEDYLITSFLYNDLGLVKETSELIIRRDMGANTSSAAQDHSVTISKQNQGPTYTTVTYKLIRETNQYDLRGFKTETIRNHAYGLYSTTSPDPQQKNTNTYTLDGQLDFQKTEDLISSVYKLESNLDYEYNPDGSVKSFVYADYDKGTYKFNNTYSYAYVDTYAGSQVQKITVTSSQDGTGKGTTINNYDSRGRMISASITESKVLAPSETGQSLRYFNYNTAGQIIARAEQRYGETTFKVQNFYYSPTGGELANFGAKGVDISPLSSVSEGGNTPDSYKVNEGDTLLGIADTMFGDSKLWYLIADANGLAMSPTEQFASTDAGRNLRIPNVDKNISNTSTNWKPYNPTEIIGDLTPNPSILPPPKAGGCGVFAMIIMIIVAVVLTIVTAGAAAMAMGATGGSLMGTGMAALGGTLGTTAGITATGFAASAGLAVTGAVAAAAGGFVGSVASQLVGKGMGVVEHFSLRQAVGSGLTAGFTAGAGAYLSSVGNGALVAKNAQGAAEGLKWYGRMAQGAASYAGSYASNKIVELDASFSWKDMAVASVSSSIAGSKSMQGATKAIGNIGGSFGENVIGNLAGSALNSGLSRLAGRGRTLHSDDWANMAADAFGNALATVIVEYAQKPKPLKYDPLIERRSKSAFEMDLDRQNPNQSKMGDGDTTQLFKDKNTFSISEENWSIKNEIELALGLEVGSSRYGNLDDLANGEFTHVFKIKGAGSIHEKISEFAAIDAGLEFSKEMEIGSRWPDVPDPDQIGTDYLSTWWNEHNEGTLAHRSHHGDLQIMHSMSPSGNMTNSEILDEIVLQAWTFYEGAVEYRQSRDYEARSHGDFEIGKLLHMVQDSYSKSHVVRNDANEVVGFQNYESQDSDKHGLADKKLHNHESWKDISGVPAAIKASTQILKFYKDNASFQHVEDYLRGHVYKFQSGTENKIPTGSSSEFKKNSI